MFGAKEKFNHFIAGSVIATEDGEAMSATRVRKALVERNKAELQQLLAPELYTALVTEKNLDAVERRYHLCLEMEKEKAENKIKQEQLKSEFDKQYRYTNPLTGKPLLDAKQTQKKLTKSFASKKMSLEDQNTIINYID
jgi:hypothetical protein